MNKVCLQVNELSASAFLPFGDVIEVRGACQEINQGTTQRYHDLAKIDVLDQAGRPLLNIFRARPRPRPLKLELLERHPLSSQAFFPLESQPYLVIVAPPAEDVSVDKIVAFLASGRQGVNYHRGVWHHPLLALGCPTDFIVIDRGGEGENCDEHYFAKDDEIIIDY